MVHAITNGEPHHGYYYDAERETSWWWKRCILVRFMLLHIMLHSFLFSLRQRKRERTIPIHLHKRSSGAERAECTEFLKSIECLQNLKWNVPSAEEYANFALTIAGTENPVFLRPRPGLCLLLFPECIHIINSLRGRQEELIINYNNEMEHGIACLKKLLSLFTIFLLLRLFSLIACIVSLNFFSAHRGPGWWWCLWLLLKISTTAA